MRRLATTLIAALAAVLAPAAANAAAPLTASQPVSAQVPKFQQAIADHSCDELMPLLTTISARPAGTQPGAPPTAEECSANQSIFDAWAGYKPGRTRDLGTVALTDGKLDGVKEQVWILDSDRVYRYLEGLVVSKSDLAAKLAGRAQAAATAGKLLAALRRHSCKQLNAITPTGGPFTRGFKSRADFCKAVLGGFFASELKASPKAKPVFEGGTGGIAAFYVQTAHGLTTVLVDRVRGKRIRYGVLDYAFNERSA